MKKPVRTGPKSAFLVPIFGCLVTEHSQSQRRQPPFFINLGALSSIQELHHDHNWPSSQSRDYQLLREGLLRSTQTISLDTLVVADWRSSRPNNRTCALRVFFVDSLCVFITIPATARRHQPHRPARREQHLVRKPQQSSALLRSARSVLGLSSKVHATVDRNRNSAGGS